MAVIISGQMSLQPETFFFKIPLYGEIEITSDNWSDFTHLIQFRGRVEGYNPIRGANSTFAAYEMVSGQIERGNLDYLFSYGEIFKLSIKCLRYDDILSYFVKYTPKYEEDEDGDLTRVPNHGILMKVGQNPPLVDFHIEQIKKFKGLLTKEKQKEFVRAVGLVTHGVGIGSFVYLRRIFEDLIQEAYLVASGQSGWNDVLYKESRMTERIELLKNHLPDFLVKNRGLYGIMSKGIHELSEIECLDYFDTVRLGIERILEEKLEQQQKEKKDKEATDKIEELRRKLK